MDQNQLKLIKDLINCSQTIYFISFPNLVWHADTEGTSKIKAN